MPDDLLTPDAVSHAPEALETRVSDEGALHDVATPEQTPVPEAANEEAPVEAAVPPPPPNPEPMAPAAQADEEEPTVEEEQGAAPAEPEAEPTNKRWYVVKVQSGREDTIKEAIERRVKIERLEEFFGEIRIPVERVTEMRNGKRVVKEKKMYPGYLMANVEYNDRILYLFRETSGVGDFVGGTLNRPPPPMSSPEIDRMMGGANRKDKDATKIVEAKPPVERGDRVRVRDGTFAGMEGEVKEILEKLNHLKVELTIFGRPVSVELEYWQVETV